jgi:hypothetical protein
MARRGDGIYLRGRLAALVIAAVYARKSSDQVEFRGEG